MANQRNYQKEMEQVIERQKQDGYVPASAFAQLLCALLQLCVGETLSEGF